MRKLLLLPLLLLPQLLSAESLSSQHEQLWKKLEKSLEKMERDFDGAAGIHLIDLESGEEIAVNSGDVYPAASTIKIAILAELVRQNGSRASKTAKLADVYAVDADDLVGGAGLLHLMTPEVTRLSNRDLAVLMMGLSDNSATNVLIDRLGIERINELLEEHDFSQMRLRRKMMDTKAAAEGKENLASPRELALFLANLERGEILERDATSEFRSLLATPKETPFQRLLPAGAVLDSKSGELEGVRNEVGIMRAPHRTFVLAVMTSHAANERGAEELLSRIALRVWETAELFSRASEHGRLNRN